MDAKSIIGKCIKRLREAKELSQDDLAHKGGITYQYLSTLENGKENFSIGVLESIAKALGLNVAKLVALAFATEGATESPRVNPKYFRTVPLPGKLDVAMIEKALNETQRIIFQINSNLRAIGARPLHKYIQGNNFSGLVSNMLCDSLSEMSCFKHNSHQAYPDLIYPCDVTRQDIGLEVKTTTKIGKGGESHNGHRGWHMIACFKINVETGDILFLHVMVAQLNSHTHARADWKYIGSKVNEETGSRRTETYITTGHGLTKLRDGSVYVDPELATNIQRWRPTRLEKRIPVHSIFYKPKGTK